MRRATLQSPVVVSHPLTKQFVTIAKGMEFADNDPVVKEFAWAFVKPDVEQATAAPGEKRTAKRDVE